MSDPRPHVPARPASPSAAAVLEPGTETTVVLVKSRGREVTYPATAERDDGVHVVVRAPWAGPPVRDFGFVRFESGDVFTEHYWRDRWYSVKEVRGPDGTLKGWYCDITRPAAVGRDTLTTWDLELDLWVSPDRSAVLRLDEDEFAESGLPEREPETAGRARRALDELERLARTDGFAALLD
ncbi:DUF402 domain-containing protein [Streptomyces sp. TRM43335]|uniref:DUF402 domain-containing protein n=1 Tax=Streptomyces taklimakanensis TaxID=2569853 RepID=A0A6G2BH78_9ACTN|nr:DUF402 domain-containing protein [Streptomyces taklimakanensis]MTE21618.1 DUF402 domain-containing protein [Streptomyces taklimakanensis]